MENFQKDKIENNKEKRIMEDLYCSKSKMNIINISQIIVRVRKMKIVRRLITMQIIMYHII